ncbi:hypothetical protein MVEN_02227600 [Mycena venus]|uniref:Mitochondrial carrier n=1 Tax=Mycena venus TaxID=2733690 RepID=A0A8H6X7W3_9AGAR|nr:hypothetical protein MVEN_02227600 [Mycena venus]
MSGVNIFIAVLVDVVSPVLLFAFILGTTTPFVGVLVRYRANYTPKTGAVRLDDEDAASRANVAIGYFGMMKRVYSIEGWAGLYKGIMPSIIAISIALAVVIVSTYAAVMSRIIHHGRIVRWLLNVGLSIIPALLIVPMKIIVNRAITTPHRLSAFDARTALRVLLSPAERTQPLRLYLAPGVAFAIALEGLIVASFNLFRIAIDSLPLGFAIGGLVPVLLLTAAIITPLEVMIQRLTLQRRSRLTPGLAPSEDAIPPPPVYSAEPVMEFRGTDIDSGEAPYTGLLDCTRKIVAEEGWSVLTRAWWLTLAAMVLSVAAPWWTPRRWL